MTKKLIAAICALVVGVSALGIPAYAAAETESAEGNIIIHETETQTDMALPEENEKISINPAMECDEFLDFEPDVQRDENSAELMAAKYNISGTVSLPSGVSLSEDKTVMVYAFKPSVDGNEILEDNSGTVASSRLTMKKGTSSVSYSLSVDKGDYIVGTRMLEGDKNVLGQTTYYSSKGSINSEYAAEKISVSSNVSGKNITFIKAESSISGTVDIGYKVTADTTVTLSADPTGAYTMPGDCYAYPTIKAGASTAAFEIGVAKGSYYIYGNNRNGTSGSFNGKYIDSSWENRLYFNTENRSYSDLSVVFDGEPETRETFNVTLNFRSALTEQKEYIVLLYDGMGDSITAHWVTVNSGSKTYTTEFTYDTDEYDKFYIGYAEITGSRSASHSSGTKYFYSSEYGVVGSLSMATAVEAKTKSITVTEPPAYTVSGTMTLPTAGKGDSYAYVIAKFEDGETFRSRVKIDAGKLTAPYTLYIPQRLRSQSFNLFYGRAKNDYTTDETEYEDKLTLTGNLSGINVTLAEAPAEEGQINVSGTITFSTAAPATGMVVMVEDDYNSSGRMRYYVSPGSRTLNYSLTNVEQHNEKYYIRAEIEAYCPSSMVSYIYQDVNAREVSGGAATIDLSFGKTVSVSGRVSVSEGTTLTDYASFEIYGSSYDGSYTTYGTMTPGSTYVDYTLYLPENSTLRYIYVDDINDLSDLLYNDRIFYSEDGGTSKYNEIDKKYTGNLSGMDITIPEGISISGTITLPKDGYFEKGTDGDYPYINIYVEGENADYSTSVKWNGESADYSIMIPKNKAGDYKLYYSISRWNNYNTNLATGIDVYYTSDGMVFDSDSAEVISLTKSVSGKDFVLSKGLMITGKITIPSDAYINGGDIRVHVYAESISGSNTYSKAYTINSSSPKELDYSISVSPADKGDYKIYYNIDVYNDTNTNLVDAERYYYTTTGMKEYSADETISVQDNVSGINIELQKGYILSGTVTMPEGGYTNESLSVNIYFRSENKSYSRYIAFNGEPAPFSICLPNTMESYSIEYYTYANGCDTNLAYKTLYYTSEGGTANSDDAEKLANNKDYSDIELVLPLGRLITGKLILPEDAFYSELGDTFELRLRSDYSYNYYTARLSEDLTYICVIPDDLTGDYNVDAEISSQKNSNIYGKYYPYKKDGEEASVDFTGSGTISGIDFNVETGIYISGKLIIPIGAVFDEDDAGCYVGVYGADSVWVSLSNRNDKTYSLIVPKDTESIKIYASVTTKWSDLEDNLDRDTYAYYNSKGTVYSEEEAEELSKTKSRYDNIDITVPMVNSKITATIANPEELSSSIDYMLCAEFDNGEIYSRYDSASSEVEKLELNVPVTETSDHFLLYFKLTDPDYYRDILPEKIYINSDGTSTIERSKAQKYTSGSYDVYFDIPTYETLDEGYLLESEHPYTSGTKKYTYEHPTDAAHMYVRFSDNCKLSEDDSIRILDGDNNQIDDTYTGNELAGKVIKIDGNTFTVELNSTYSGNNFGFAVTDIITDEVSDGKIKVTGFPVNQDGEVINYSNAKNTETVSFDVASCLTEEKDAAVIIAAYNGDTLCGMKVTELHLDSETSKISDVPCAVEDENCDSIKIFIWDELEGMFPLMDAYKCS